MDTTYWLPIISYGLIVFFPFGCLVGAMAALWLLEREHS